MKTKLAVMLFSGAALAGQAGFAAADASDLSLANSRATQYAEQDTTTRSDDAYWYRQGVDQGE
ncbi:MAG: hypothetical protein HY661_10375 [Betaproteobacteria bacterium]|nr:hypothetical protein [Betaproteobacteria bacterium]